jgi:anti-sigma B factor antagonist
MGGVGHDCTIVRLEGEWDISRARELQTELSAAIERGADVVVDLTGVELLDSTALGMLLTAHQRCDLRRLGFAIALPSDAPVGVRRGIRFLGLRRITPFFETAEEAAGHLRRVHPIE